MSASSTATVNEESARRRKHYALAV